MSTQAAAETYTVKANGVVHRNVKPDVMSVMVHVFGSDAEVRPTCVVTVVVDRSQRYPHRAQCSCGWVSRGYVREHAAQLVADGHAEAELAER